MKLENFKNKILYKKVLATIVVSIFFIFFWINGPLQVMEVLAHLEQEETEFSKPKIVGEVNEIKSYGEIEDAETKGDGWSLITKNRNKKNKESGLISTSKSDVTYSEAYAKKLIEHAQKIIPGKIETEVVPTQDFLYLKIKQNKLTFFYQESANMFNEIRGYSGSINIGLLVNDNGEIEKVQHVSSKETESYLNKIVKEGFYQRFEKLPLEESRQINAVSGATLTTGAIAQITSELAKISVKDYTDYLNVERDVISFEVIAKNSLWWILHITVIGMLFLYGFQKKYKKTKKSIKVLSLVSVLYIGFFMNSSFTYVSFLHPFLGTTVSTFVALYALFSLLGAIWGKNVYCKYVCPFGHAQRLSLQLSKKKFSTKFFIPNKWVKRIRDLFTAILIVGILLGLRSWSNYEIFPDFFGLEFISEWFLISLIIILTNLKYPFIWCRIACPTGAVLDKISDITK